jgi:hypothetical protein
VKKLKGRRVDRTQHADGVKAMPPAPPQEASAEEPGEPQNETDQANVVYRRGDDGTVADEQEP